MAAVCGGNGGAGCRHVEAGALLVRSGGVW